MSKRGFHFSVEDVKKAEEFVLKFKRENKFLRRTDETRGLLGSTFFHCNTTKFDILRNGLGYDPFPSSVAIRSVASHSYHQHLEQISHLISRHDWKNALKLLRYIFQNKGFRTINKFNFRIYSNHLQRALIYVIFKHPEITTDNIHKIMRVLFPKSDPKAVLKLLFENETLKEIDNKIKQNKKGKKTSKKKTNRKHSQDACETNCEDSKTAFEDDDPEIDFDDEVSNTNINDGASTIIFDDDDSTIFEDGGSTILDDVASTTLFDDGASTTLFDDGASTTLFDDGASTINFNDEASTIIFNGEASKTVCGDNISETVNKDEDSEDDSSENNDSDDDD